MRQSDNAQALMQLHRILVFLCVRLQITPTQFAAVETSYEAVRKWLSGPGSKLASFDPFIFPQGSLRHDTTVRPRGQQEFDLDLVCKLLVRGFTPFQLYELIWDRMHESETYRPKIERKPRCIRVNYAGQYHLDLVPAIPCPTFGGEYIRVPEIPEDNLQKWKFSNPIGLSEFLNKKAASRRVANFAEARADHEPLKDPAPVTRKQPLKLAIQILKRWRDVEYDGRMHLSPPSIVLTVLAAQYYEGDDSLPVVVGSIVNRMVEATAGSPFDVHNPAHRHEVVSERWRDNPASFYDFAKSIRRLRDDWAELIALRGLGDIASKLKRLFGETAGDAIKEASEQFEKARTENRAYLVPSTRTLTDVAAVSSIRMSPTRFYGDD